MKFEICDLNLNMQIDEKCTILIKLEFCSYTKRVSINLMLHFRCLRILFYIFFLFFLDSLHLINIENKFAPQ